MDTITLFDTVIDLFFVIYSTAQNIMAYMLTPIKDLVGTDTVLQDVLSKIIEYGLGDFSLLTLMVGPALITYLVYQFVVWVLNVVT